MFGKFNFWVQSAGILKVQGEAMFLNYQKIFQEIQPIFFD